MGSIRKKSKNTHTYEKFEKLDGSHPFKIAVPGAYVDYQARKRYGGKVRYFNFSLAREMGLISTDHPDELNSELERKILDAFAIVIINEFDIEHKKKFQQTDILPGKYMATRYLQLQHEDKLGRTSGDGRSIWNGQIKHKGKTWDVSSCGTGATKLSPATSKFKRYFETGDPTISYGCGYAELDEGLGTAIYSEVMKRNNIETEESLAIIEFGKHYSINVRAHNNLLRPSHFFNHLKQGNLISLKRIVDYYIEVERNNNSDWKNCPHSKKKYDFFLQKVMETFARTVAKFEAEYIFCWLDWDGDNILMDGGIIDYGSIRQFGLFHAEYRYDDVDRYSTNILEQKQKGRYTVQSFIQVVDFIKTGSKKPINKFNTHHILKDFDKNFEYEKNRSLMHKQGFTLEQTHYLLTKHWKQVMEFRKRFYYFERAKSHRGPIKVGDGVSWDAIFCMRDLMREMPQIYLSRGDRLDDEEFVDILASNYASADDLEMTPYRKRMIREYQDYYLKLIKYVAKDKGTDQKKILLQMGMRSSVINRVERVTGDSVTHIVDKIMKERGRYSASELSVLIEQFATSQAFDLKSLKKWDHNIDKKHFAVMNSFFEIVNEYREGI